MIRKIYPIIWILLGISLPGNAQQIGTWESQTAKSEVSLIQADKDGRIWSATGGGLFVLEDGEITAQYTPAEGMFRVSPTAMVYDEPGHRIWLGYLDGTFESFDIDDQRFRVVSDITRADQYNPRGISTMAMRGDTLYIATDFGIVIYNTTTRSTSETYFNLGAFSPGTRVQDIAFRGNELFAATPSGIAVGDLESGFLELPTSWRTYGEASGLGNSNIRKLGVHGDQIYAASDTTFILDNDSWIPTGIFENQPVIDFAGSSGDHLVAVTESVIFNLGAGMQRIEPGDGIRFNTALYLEDSGQLFLGTTNQGVGIIEDGQVSGLEYRMPPGPYLNFFTGLSYDDGVIISGSSSSPGRVSTPIQSTGYYIYREGEWESYNNETNDVLRQRNFRSTFTSSFTDDYYFFGSWGQGLARHNKSTNEVTIFNTQNSPLVGYQGNSSYVVVPGLSPGRDGNLWVTAWHHDQLPPLYRYNPSTDEWTSFPRSPQALSNDTYYNLTVDSFDQKWISLRSISLVGRGLLVTKTEGDEIGESIRLSEENGNLPNNSVNALVQDNRGEMWVGTDFGVVRFPFPDRVITGNAADRQGSRLINADTTAGASFLLSTIKATAIAVNAANDKWIGTEGDGLWLISESGGRHRVRHHFTTENSPLISDNITSLVVDDVTGRVFIATDEGLVTYTDVTRGGEPEMASLFIYPNPFSYQNHEERIVIEGLSDRTTVRIVGVDGQLVARLGTRGGRAVWDARDYQGNRVASGVYMVVAVDEDSGERGSGRVVIIR